MLWILFKQISFEIRLRCQRIQRNFEMCFVQVMCIKQLELEQNEMNYSSPTLQKNFQLSGILISHQNISDPGTPS
jgi:hypothetical protein